MKVHAANFDQRLVRSTGANSCDFDPATDSFSTTFASSTSMQLVVLKSAMKSLSSSRASFEGGEGYAAHSLCSFATDMNALRTACFFHLCA